MKEDFTEEELEDIALAVLHLSIHLENAQPHGEGAKRRVAEQQERLRKLHIKLRRHIGLPYLRVQRSPIWPRPGQNREAMMYFLKRSEETP